MNTLKILLVDDHVVLRQGVRRLIDGQADMAVVAEASDGIEAVQLLGTTAVEMALVDVTLGRGRGPEAIREMKRAQPDLKILGLSMHEDAGHVRSMIDAGAMGYVVKRAAAVELIEAIRTVGGGGLHIDPRVTNRLLGSLVPDRGAAGREKQLSEREGEVLRLIAQGFSNREIAHTLSLSTKTIETYKARGMEKLELRSRVDLVKTAAVRGWLPA
jgi:two-component system response regulator NreC